MDQTEPLAEVTHKRRLSALSAMAVSPVSVQVSRSVTFTIPTMVAFAQSEGLLEGPNIGLISSLCLYANINDLWASSSLHIASVVDSKVDMDNDHVVYLTAEGGGRRKSSVGAMPRSRRMAVSFCYYGRERYSR